MSAACFIVWADFAGEDEAEFEEWYDREHMRQRVLATPGFSCGRRFRMDVGTPRHLAVYEADDPRIFSSPGYLSSIAGPDARSQRFMAGFRNVIVAVGKSLGAHGDSFGGTIGIFVFDASDGHHDELTRTFRDGLTAGLVRHQGILRAQCFATDRGQLSATTLHHSRHGDRSPDFVLMLEGASLRDIRIMRAGVLSNRSLGRLGASWIQFGAGSLVAEVRPRMEDALGSAN